MLLDGEPKVDGIEENGDLRLTVKGDGTRFHCVLSAEHDYQPSRMVPAPETCGSAGASPSRIRANGVNPSREI
jgi:hypothetical protein